MSSPLLRLNYPLDKELLLADANQAREFAKSFNQPRFENQNRKPQDYFKMSQWTSPYIEQIMLDLNVVGSPRFYFQDAFSELKMHTDINTLCSVNMVLSDDPAPITFEDGVQFYEQALLNVQIPHAVVNGPNARILFKISIFNETFDQVAEKIKYKGVV